MILAKDSVWNAPGHNSIIHDDKGGIWMVYHAVWQDKEKAGPAMVDNHYLKRVMCIYPVLCKKGWPEVIKKY